MEKQLMKLVKIHTDKNPSDMMIKGVTRDKLEVCKNLIGMDFKWEVSYPYGCGGGELLAPVHMEEVIVGYLQVKK